MNTEQVKICLSIIDDMVFTKKIYKAISFVVKIKKSTDITFRFRRKPLEKLLAMLQVICAHKNRLGLLHGLKLLWVNLLQESVVEGNTWYCFIYLHSLQKLNFHYFTKGRVTLKEVNWSKFKYKFGAPYTQHNDDEFVSYWSRKIAHRGLTFKKWKQALEDYNEEKSMVLLDFGMCR